MHAGAAELRDGDYFGGTVNRAARIMSVAHGEQLLLSGAIEEAVRRQLPDGVTLRELGEHRLKGLVNPELLLQVVAPGLRADFPPLASAGGHSLPAERDAFVGRREALSGLQRRFGDGARLVSIPRPRWHRQNAVRHALRLGLAWKVSGRRLVLRSFASAKSGRYRPRGCAGTRRSVEQGRPGDADRSRDRRPRAMPGDPRQLRAGRASRRRNAGPVVEPGEQCAVPRDIARGVGPVGRRGVRARATVGDGLLVAVRAARARRRRPSSSQASRTRRPSPRWSSCWRACRWRSSWRQRGCG
jgi:hypothetical protein